MKKLIYTSVLAIFLISCEDKLFLEPTSDISLTGFYRTADDIELAVAGAYDALQSYGQYGSLFKFYMEVRSDNSYVEDLSRSSGQRGQFDVFTLESNNTFVNDTWVSCYEGVQRCNVILNRIDNVSMAPTVKNSRKGETLFLRALTYFNMVRIWGDIPLVSEEINNPFDAFDHVRNSAEEVYELIEEDLLDAIELLPTENMGDRVEKGAAQTLLAKVYLTRGRDQEAAQLLQAVINSDQYRLLDNYEDVFGIDNEGNNEIIFEVQFKKGGLGEGSPHANEHAPTNATDLVGNVGNTVGDNLPIPELYNAYTDEDKRKNMIGQLTDGRLYSKKYLDVPTSNLDGGNNVIVLRYADVLLMYAEAMNNIGYQADGEAFDYLNMVRERAGLPSFSSSELNTQESFDDAIQKERQLELSFENHRWFDLVRTGTALPVMQNHTYPNPNITISISENNLLFPIPLTQIDASSGLLDQNQGYL